MTPITIGSLQAALAIKSTFSMFTDQAYELLSPPLQLEFWRLAQVVPPKSNCDTRTTPRDLEKVQDRNMPSHALAMNELRSRRSSKIEDLDSPSDLKKLDLHLVKKTTTAHLSTKTLQIEEELAYDEVAVTLEESDYQKSADNSTIPSLSGSVTPASVLDGRLANFGVVTPGIYRSAWPASDTYDFVKSLNLKTIVYVESFRVVSISRANRSSQHAGPTRSRGHCLHCIPRVARY